MNKASHGCMWNGGRPVNKPSHDCMRNGGRPVNKPTISGRFVKVVYCDLKICALFSKSLKF